MYVYMYYFFTHIIDIFRSIFIFSAHFFFHNSMTQFFKPIYLQNISTNFFCQKSNIIIQTSMTFIRQADTDQANFYFLLMLKFFNISSTFMTALKKSGRIEIQR